jgi:hypothetical protein
MGIWVVFFIITPVITFFAIIPDIFTFIIGVLFIVYEVVMIYNVVVTGITVVNAIIVV